MKDTSFCGLTGVVITPESPEYNELRQEWNRAVQKFPIAIVYCYNKYDVANAVFWTECFGVPFRIRNGGHNYEGYSTGNGVLVIDTTNLNFLSIADQTVTSGGGVKNRQFYDFVASQGYPFPSGTCPTVGVSGLASGGGWGLSCRNFGLACDSLIELEIVNYNGEIIKANAKKNADLFWACRGAGGGNFGVIVSMTFRLPPKVEKVTFIEFVYLNTGAEKQTRFFKVWQNWLKDADEKMSLIAGINHEIEDNYINVRGIFYGTPEEAEFILMPFMSINGFRLNLEYITFLEAINKIEAIYPPSEMFKSVGRFVVESLSVSEMSKLVGFLRDAPEGSVNTSIRLYSFGGKVSEVKSDDTAFFYRDAKYITLIQSIWEDKEFAEINTQWVEDKAHYLRSITQGSYVNFPDGGLGDYLEAYYGENAERLKIIKKKYDPFNVFRFPQSIPEFDYKIC